MSKATKLASHQQISMLSHLGIDKFAAALMEKTRAAELINDLSSRTGSEYIVRYGKHCGLPIREVPPRYLDWMSKNMTDKALLQNIRIHLEQQAVV